MAIVVQCTRKERAPNASIAPRNVAFLLRAITEGKDFDVLFCYASKHIGFEELVIWTDPGFLHQMTIHRYRLAIVVAHIHDLGVCITHATRNISTCN
jgi:hypothetical protein